MEKDEKIKSINEEIKNKQVKTYAEDMAKVIEGDSGGLIKKIIHEQEAYEIEKRNLSPSSSKNKTLIFSSLVLIFFALALFMSLNLFHKKAGTVDLIPRYTPPIFIDQNYFKEISSLTKDEIVQSVYNEVKNVDIKKGGIEGIYLTEDKQVIGLQRFIELIQGNFNLEWFSFIDDNFLLGATSEKNKNLFFLLKVSSFADVFEPFRSWESKLFSDLHGFFGVDLSPDTKYLITKNFENGFIANKNARILRDNEGEIVLTYVFVNDNFVVITNKEEAAAEVITRLTGSQIKK